MTELFQIVVLGIIQGLTEFIPVSSSGHLEIVPLLFGWDKPNTILVLFAHLGTLLALILFFRRDLWQFVKAIKLAATNRASNQPLDKQTLQSLRLIRLLVLATIPAGILGFAASEMIENFYDNNDNPRTVQIVTLAAMSILGLVFLLSRRWFRGKKINLSQITYRSAFFVGASQALAFVRGTSRSGISLLAGQFAGLNRVDAARFSFLMSLPLIGAASVVGVIDLIQLSPDEMYAQLPAAIAIMVSSLVSGFIAIRYLLEYLSNRGLTAFGWYRVIFAAIAALLLF